MNAGVKGIAVGVMPDLFGLVAVLDEDGPATPIVFFARDVAPTLQEEDFLTGGSQLIGQRAAAGPGADDNDVVVSGSGH